MKKKVWISVLILVPLLIVIGSYSFVRYNPPVEVGTVASGTKNKSVVVGIRNNGFGKVEILNVTVNNKEKPLKERVQVNDKGFLITEDYDNKEDVKEYGFKKINEVIIETDTTFSERFKELSENSSDYKEDGYGISVLYKEPINKVEIEYRYFGVTFEETVDIPLPQPI
ncbi:hypothetical protein SFC65_19180 [Priestia filamentosa]|uniref:hypothetical protein n=1 Tax=Priestia filamentosa TaxID=1402861 RepID=UPI003982BEB6